jgi:two-component system, chemotaxis family, chemotaxis protein CheY
MRILIADDSAVMRRIHRNVLTERKIPDSDIIEAENGNQALASATLHKIDLFLLDWNMPRMDGFELVKKIRALPQYAKTPIIMITSEGAKYNVIEAIQAGVNNYIVKPVRGDVLWQKVSPYLSTGT